MNKQEFLKQMISFGQELLAQEQKPKTNKKAANALQRIYNGLEEAVNGAADLEEIFENDKRKAKAAKAVNLIMKVQELMNPMAEDEDINLPEP